MYRNRLRVFASPPRTPQDLSPHPHRIVVDTFGEGRAGTGSISCGSSYALRSNGACGKEDAALKYDPILRQIIGKGGLSNKTSGLDKRITVEKNRQRNIAEKWERKSDPSTAALIADDG